jgi:hypothetical protein
MMFLVGIFFKKFPTYFAIKISTNWWNLYYDAKSGKYHDPEKQHFPSVLAPLPPYNLWGCLSPPFWSHRVGC